MGYHHQGYDPPVLPHQFYDQSAEDYRSYTYSNPQYASNQPYPYHSVNVQPSPRGEQEPNPPVVILQPPQRDPNAYYRSISCCAAAYNAAPQQGGMDTGFATVHQPIVQSSYNNGIGRVQTVFTQVGPSQPRLQSHEPGLVPASVPLTGQAQSAPSPKHIWCELCRVECNTLEHLNQHNSGKKHMKKLKTFEESQKASTFKPVKTLASAIQQLPQKSSLPSQDINEVEKRKDEEAKPLWCELCKANCNTLEVFNNHLNGRRHQKKMKSFENLKKSQVDVQMEESKVAIEKQQVEAGEKVEACGSKRKMGNGEIRSVKSKSPAEPLPKEEFLCELCEVKCESQVAFQSHIVGKKHLLNAKRFLSENKTLGQEVFQILKHAIQALEQNVSSSLTSFMASQLDHCCPMIFQAPKLEANLESARAKDISEPK